MTKRIVSPPVTTRVDDELAFHIAMHTRDLVAQGVPEAEARRRAEGALGDRRRVAAECRRIDADIDRATRRTRYLSEIVQDARFAIRMLARRRTFAAIAIGTLALGIGAATSIYSVVDGVMLRPLPFSEPERLAAVWVTEPGFAANPSTASLAQRTPLGHAEFERVRASAKQIQGIGLWTNGASYVDGDEGLERTPVVLATSSLLPTLRVTMALGRRFMPGEDVLDGAHVALLSWEQWQGRYRGDSSVLGRSVVLDRKPYIIVGVLPRGLRLDRTSDVTPYWIPALQDSSDLIERHNRNYMALARLAPHATFAGATTELTGIERASRPRTTTGMRAEQWQRDEAQPVRSALLALLGASVFLLGIACVNVAVLMLGEATSRAREMAARAALGAGSGRLTRQLLVESLIIALGSAVLGCALAWAMMRGLVALAPAQLPGLGDVHMNVRVLAFAFVVAAGTGLLFGIAPALSAGRLAVASLARMGLGHTGRRHVSTQRALIALQLALSTVLLTEAFLMGRSFERLLAVPPGFSSERLSVARVSLPRALFRDDDRIRDAVQRMQLQLEALPGVARAIPAVNAPFAGGNSSSPVLVDVPGQPDPVARGKNTQQRYVGAGFFELLGVRLTRGRFFTNEDRANAATVAIISEAMVRRDFGTGDPIGRRVKHQGAWRTVVGVVADIKYAGLGRADEATLYAPFEQFPSSGLDFVLQELRPPTLATLRREVRRAEPNAVVTRYDVLETLKARTYANERYRTVLVAAFALVAAVLAAVGMYGVGTRAVARRTREVGVRLALGSTRGAVSRLLVADAMLGVFAGVVIGIPAALALGRFVQPFLFGVAPTDAVSYAGTVLLLAAVTLLASLVPSRRASRANPATVLRAE